MLGVLDFNAACAPAGKAKRMVQRASATFEVLIEGHAGE
jgi:hypothetical protein